MSGTSFLPLILGGVDMHVAFSPSFALTNPLILLWTGLKLGVMKAGILHRFLSLS